MIQSECIAVCYYYFIYDQSCTLDRCKETQSSLRIIINAQAPLVVWLFQKKLKVNAWGYPVSLRNMKTDTNIYVWSGSFSPDNLDALELRRFLLPLTLPLFLILILSCAAAKPRLISLQERGTHGAITTVMESFLDSLLFKTCNLWLAKRPQLISPLWFKREADVLSLFCGLTF